MAEGKYERPCEDEQFSEDITARNDPLTAVYQDMICELNNRLKLAVRNGKTSKVSELIEAGAKVNATSYSEGTLLSYSVENNNESMVRLLIDAGADVNVKTNYHGQTPLFYAVQSNNESMVRLLIDAGADVSKTNYYGQTALFYAAQSNDESMVRLLIDAGADVSKTNYDGKTALFYVAVQSNNESMVRLLIDAGADVNDTDNEGRTALFHFVGKTRRGKKYSDFKHVIDVLLDSGMDVNKVDKQGKTVLYWAANADDVELTHRFIEAGADTNISDYRGQTALFAAVIPEFIVTREDETEVFMFLDIPYYETVKMNVVRALVEDGKADVNARDTHGRTPLFYAIQVIKSLPITTYLIENGANLKIRDNCGVSVLSFFLENCMIENPQVVYAYVYPSLPCDMYKVLDLFLQNGMTKHAVFDEAIVNVVFCKTLLMASHVSVSDPRNKIQLFIFNVNILKVASDCLMEGENTKKKIIENILTMVQESSRDYKFYEFLVPEILSLLIELGANPNSADVNGNTALHFAACLPLYGLSGETVMKICHQLGNFGVIFNIRNHRRETPLLFCLSPSNHPAYCWREDDVVSKLKILRDVYTFLLRHGLCADETTLSGDSVFHLLLKLFQEICRGRDLEEKTEVFRTWQLFFEAKLYLEKDTINMRENVQLDSPLHMWATLEVINIQDPEKTLKPILKHLLEYGASLNVVNKKGEAPLHVCSSWTAVTLLLDSGADPCVSDSLGRQPLLVAAESAQSLPRFLQENRLYFDLLLEPREFWRSAIQRGLDPWTVDKRGESVLSVLIKSEQFVLAEALVEVARDDNYLQSETIATSLLIAICKDRSTRAHWKSYLAEMILKSINGSSIMGHNNETSPLHHCCLNIVENSNAYGVYVNVEENTKNEVHWTIAKQLLLYGADCTVADSTGKSCLDIAKTNPALKDLLTKPHDIKEVPLLIHWNEISITFKDKLAKVARRLESKHVKPYWYHQDHLASGSFGFVFAGINEKDGREVAIKRIEKRRMTRPEDKREITNLIALADCENVVRYLSFFEDEHFSYIVLELMEGNLDELLYHAITEDSKVQLCQDVVMGLAYLHNQKILHRDLKPTNILYKWHPKLCLKISDFGLSRRIDSTSTTVYCTNAGTRCWTAPEILTSTKPHSKSSDMFTCGLVLHYILSAKTHPFARRKNAPQHETESNISQANMEGWDDSLCPEAADLIEAMLDGDESKRPSADKALHHPFFWSEKEKLDLLNAVGNQKEFGFPRAKRTPPLTTVETDLETNVGIKYAVWNDRRYKHMPAIYAEMTTRRGYNTNSVVELVRFIRNAYAHVTALPMAMQDHLLKDFVFFEYFPNLVMEVYKAVTTRGWDQTREEIKYVMEQ